MSEVDPNRDNAINPEAGQQKPILSTHYCATHKTFAAAAAKERIDAANSNLDRVKNLHPGTRGNEQENNDRGSDSPNPVTNLNERAKMKLELSGRIDAVILELEHIEKAPNQIRFAGAIAELKTIGRDPLLAGSILAVPKTGSTVPGAIFLAKFYKKRLA